MIVVSLIACMLAVVFALVRSALLDDVGGITDQDLIHFLQGKGSS